MENYKEKLKKLEIIANKILAVDGTPTVKLTHTTWNTKYTENGIVEIPLTHHFGIVMMENEYANATTFEELQEKLINILSE